MLDARRRVLVVNPGRTPCLRARSTTSRSRIPLLRTCAAARDGRAARNEAGRGRREALRAKALRQGACRLFRMRGGRGLGSVGRCVRRGSPFPCCHDPALFARADALFARAAHEGPGAALPSLNGLLCRTARCRRRGRRQRAGMRGAGRPRGGRCGLPLRGRSAIARPYRRSRTWRPSRGTSRYALVRAFKRELGITPVPLPHGRCAIIACEEPACEQALHARRSCCEALRASPTRPIWGACSAT